MKYNIPNGVCYTIQGLLDLHKVLLYKFSPKRLTDDDGRSLSRCLVITSIDNDRKHEKTLAITCELCSGSLCSIDSMSDTGQSGKKICRICSTFHEVRVHLFEQFWRALLECCILLFNTRGTVLSCKVAISLD